MSKFLMSFMVLALVSSCSSSKVSIIDNDKISEGQILKTQQFAELLIKLDANKFNDQRPSVSNEQYLSIYNSNSREAKIIK